MSLARRHRTRMLAAKSAAAEASGELPASGPAATEYELLRARLGVDLRRLKEIQSIEAKIALKRTLLPAYADWVRGRLAAAAEEGARGVQDDILAQVMIWLIDVGEFGDALLLAAHVLRWGIELPARFERTAGCLIAEEIADAALKELATVREGEAFDLETLLQTEKLTENEDMPDQVRSKLFKAIGRVLARRADGIEPDADGPAGAKPAAIAYALIALRRALELNEHAGVKKEIERLEREQRKLAEAEKSSPSDENPTAQ